MKQMRHLFVAAILIAVAPTAAIQARQGDRQKTAPPGALVDIGGFRLHIHCVGTGSPTVVFEAGAGDFSTRWSAVQQRIAKRSRACAYDRAGSGWSETGPTPRTMQQEVSELHSLLTAAGVAAPYVLVGHSYGGLLVRLYVDRYGKEVSGIVLVDPTHENTRLSIRGTWVRVRERATEHPEDDFAVQLQQLYESRKKTPQPFGDRPLIVLAAAKPSAPPPGIPDAEWQELQKEKSDEKADLTRLSRNAKLVSDPSSGHLIHVDNPLLVVSAIEAVINAAARRTRLPDN